MMKLVPFNRSLKPSMRGGQKKCNFTACVSSARPSGSGSAVVKLRCRSDWSAIYSSCDTNSSHMPVNDGNMSAIIDKHQ